MCLSKPNSCNGVQESDTTYRYVHCKKESRTGSRVVYACWYGGQPYVGKILGGMVPQNA
jgi:hypothetical protein